MKQLMSVVLSAALLPAAELPVTRVTLYKNGVAYYERAGDVKAGESARLDFQVSEMDDVLKSLVLDVTGGVARVRYELSEPLQRKLSDQGINIQPQQPLALILDQWRGARIELKFRGEPVAGVIVSGRLAPLPNQGERQELTVLTDSSELRLIDLDNVTALKLSDVKLQAQFAEALGAIAQSRSKDKRAVYVDLLGTGAGKLTAQYLVPAPVWKSSYRLLLTDAGDATLEGWAIIDNSSGEDWTKVDLTVVSGKPVSFVSKLYEPKFMRRPEASLAEDQAVAPVVYESAMTDQKAKAAPQRAAAFDRLQQYDSLRNRADASMAAAAPAPMMMSSVMPNTVAREAGELFEYRFAAPVTAKKGESLLLPFVQQKIGARKLLVYSDRSQLNPRNAAEITNSSGKTLDGGPITVYQPGGYSGEALMETLKAGDKRLISYSVDQGARITTNFDSGSEVLREIKAQRGVLITRGAIEVTTTYTADNSDAKEKSLLIEHPVDPGMKLLRPAAEETSPNRYRFLIKLPAKATQKLTVVQERVLENSVMVSSLTPDVLLSYSQSKVLSAAAKLKLDAILAKKREVALADRDLRGIETQSAEISRDQERLRQNINSLNRVEGQQAQVSRYAGELAKQDGALAQLRDRQSDARNRRAALEAELNGLIEKLEF